MASLKGSQKEGAGPEETRERPAPTDGVAVASTSIMDHGNEKIGEVLMVFFADGSCLFAAGNGSEGVSVVIGVGADGYMNVLVYFSDATGC
ncbi:hypothetical protein Tco_0988424 [Tanacetum coccineum]|uniref:Uncharacterized protein n=1 Tax=Tanacetum coccineum TaxID=301880 RepID=A0ABQ5ERV4_9ASTR